MERWDTLYTAYSTIHTYILYRTCNTKLPGVAVGAGEMARRRRRRR